MPRPPHRPGANGGASQSSTGGDDLASTDEIKVYKDEGEDENKGASGENLSDDKIGLVIETESKTKGSTSGDENFMRIGDKSVENQSRTGLFSSENPFAGRLPFGYHPLIAPYPYPSGPTLGLGGMPIPHHALPFYMCNNELFSQPPPAHMGLASLHHPGLHSAAASMYGLSSSAAAPTPPLYGQTPPFYGLAPPQTPSLYGISGAHAQFVHPFYSPEFPHVAWPGSSAYAMHYPGLSRFSPGSAMLPPHPGISYPGISHPALVSPQQPTFEPKSADAVPAFRSSSSSHHRWHQPYLSPNQHGDSAQTTDGYSSSRHAVGMKCGGVGRAGSPQSSQSASSKVPHVKKPLNAFMLFMKEMRQKVIDECTLKESAAINQVLGRKWHSLSRSEQAKYYEMARKEKELHRQLYPSWSARDNYAIHSKKKKVPTATLR